MKLTTLKGTTIDASRYCERILDNLRKGYGIFEQTPICKTQAGEWFWWIDEGLFEDLEKSSVESLIKELTGNQ